MRSYDAVVIGGGPAGSTAGRLLAKWGHSVALVTVRPDRHPKLAECLPPSTQKLFRFLGIQEEIDRAGFYRTTGNTVWWGRAGRRIEPYPEGWGFQVRRSEFDQLLLELARAAGACVVTGQAGRPALESPGVVPVETDGPGGRSHIQARFILDCSGRAGVLARSFRLRERNSRTIALCGLWRNERGWKVPDASHTLVEAYPDGWAWSVPVSANVRYVAFMVDPGGGPAYHAELAKTRAFRKIFSAGALEGAPWGCDASLYSARRYCGPGFLLAGDAGAFIDPLSSFGVKKALVSAWVGAVVANTCLRHPAMEPSALQFFEDRERQVYADSIKQSSAWFREAAMVHGHPFWERRSELLEPVAPEAPREEARRALEDLKRRPCIRLRRSGAVRVEPRPRIEGCEIVLRDALIAPGSAQSLDFVDNVNLPRLVELAECHAQVPELFEAYNRACPPVALPEFLGALSFLVAEEILIDRAGSGGTEL